MRAISVAVVAALVVAVSACKGQVRQGPPLPDSITTPVDTQPTAIPGESTTAFIHTGHLAIVVCTDSGPMPAITQDTLLDSNAVASLVAHEDIHIEQIGGTASKEACGARIASMVSSGDSVVKYEAPAYCAQAYDSVNSGGVLPSVSLAEYKKLVYEMIRRDVDSLYPWEKVDSGFNRSCVS